MTLKDYLNRIKIQWILIASVTFIFFTGGIAYAFFPEDIPTQVFSTSSQVLLIDARAETNSGAESSTAMATAIDLLSTEFVREKIASESGMTLNELTEKVELFGKANPDSNLLTLTAMSEDSGLPILVANAAANVIVAKSSQFFNANSEIVGTAQQASETVNLTRNTSVAKVAIPTIVGFLIGLFAAFVRAWTNNTVYSANELLGLGATRLVSVQLRRNRENNSSVIDEVDLRKVRSLLPQESGMVLVVNETNEQVFSDFVTSLTESFAILGRRILVIDADLKSQSNSTLFAQVKNGRGISPGISAPSEFSKLINRFDEFTDVVASSGLAAHPEDILGGKIFQKFIVSIRNNYDQILFLSPSTAKGSIPSTLARLVSEVLVVTETGVSELGDVSRTVKILDQSPVSSIAVVVLDSKVVTSKETAQRKWGN